MQTITVPLGKRSYPVYIAAGLMDSAGRIFAEALPGRAAAIITDDHVAPLYLARVERSLEAAGVRHAAYVLPHGESTKCLARLEELYGFLSESHITRADAVIALGGGVIGDLAGLAAATWLRGIPFMQIPTTLLAQVDSSVGGKVAVDLPQGKNLVGAFWQPSAVLVDPDTLNTLTDRYWTDGLGEVVKYGCIRDEALFELLERLAPGGRKNVMTEIDTILARCISAKAAVVAEDETDLGLRAILNFGHTVGHAVETVQGYGGVSHGEGVAIGMNVITRISEREGVTEPGTAERLEKLCRALGLPTNLPRLPERALLDAMTHDKKSAGSRLTVIRLKRIGDCGLYRTDTGYFAGMCGGEA